MPRIAVVEDDDDIILLLREMFEDRGWDVLVHTGGRAAVETLRREQPDAILLDLWLEAAETGWEILQGLRMDPATRSIPVIVCSGAADQLRNKRAWLAQCGVPTVAKPFDIDELYETVDAVLGQQVEGLQ